jgi:hypothetical protein
LSNGIQTRSREFGPDCGMVSIGSTRHHRPSWRSCGARISAHIRTKHSAYGFPWPSVERYRAEMAARSTDHLGLRPATTKRHVRLLYDMDAPVAAMDCASPATKISTATIVCEFVRLLTSKTHSLGRFNQDRRYYRLHQTWPLRQPTLCCIASRCSEGHRLQEHVLSVVENGFVWVPDF